VWLPKAERVVGLVEVAGAEDQFGLVVALEAGAGDDVEHAIGAVAELGAVAAAIDFQVVDVFGIELRADVLAMLVLGTGTPSTSQLVWWPPRMWS
jgi:hypothetical protein